MIDTVAPSLGDALSCKPHAEVKLELNQEQGRTSRKYLSGNRGQEELLGKRRFSYIEKQKENLEKD